VGRAGDVRTLWRASERGVDELRAKKRNDPTACRATKLESPWPDATLVVYAKTTADAGSKGINRLLIEKDMEGVLNWSAFRQLGMRGSNTAS